MKILVLVSDYPNLLGSKSNYFVHSRNIIYRKNNVFVDVLNFRVDDEYVIDDIYVFTKDSNIALDEYDIIVAHSPNVRNHLRYFNKNKNMIKKLVLFFHGHEVMRINEDYSKPYAFNKPNPIKVKLQDLYDSLKFKLWRNFIVNNYSSLNLVFVSNWMKKTFLDNLNLNSFNSNLKSHIIYNPIGFNFENVSYEPQKYESDFLTIRSNIDGSKYAIDLVSKLAFDNPEYKFRVYGRGNYFNHYKKPENLELIQRLLNHNEVIEELNKTRVGLFLTRTDAQGVMACEIASTGIPTLVSDIDVMHEVFDNFGNVEFINNDEILVKDIDLGEFLTKTYKTEINTTYYEKNTVNKEIELFYNILK